MKKTPRLIRVYTLNFLTVLRIREYSKLTILSIGLVTWILVCGIRLEDVKWMPPWPIRDSMLNFDVKAGRKLVR